MMETVIIVLLIIIDVFKIGNMQPCKESSWKTSITVKSNTRLGEVIFTVPDNDGKRKHQIDIQLCYTSNYFEMVYQYQWDIRVKSCMPDDYTEVLHLCSKNDGMCHGTLNITVIPFWHKRFRPMNIIVLVTDKLKADSIGITLGGCTRLQPGCSISSTNSYKLFWFSSGNHQAFIKTRGIKYEFPYMLKITCPDRSGPKVFSWLSYKSFHVKIRFLRKHIIHVASEDVSPTTHLQTAAAIPDSDRIRYPNRNSDVLRLTSMRNYTSKGLLQKRLKRGCGMGPISTRKKRDCGKGQEEELQTAPTPQMYTVLSLNTTTSSSKAALTLTMSTSTTQITTPMPTLTNKNTILLPTLTTTRTIPSTILMEKTKTPTTTSTTQMTTSATSSTTCMTTSTTPSTRQTTTSTTPSTTQTTSTIPSATQTTKSTTPSTTQTLTSTTPSTSQMTTSNTPSTTRMTTSTTPWTIQTTTSTTPWTIQTTTSTTPSTTKTTTSTTPSTTGITISTTPSTTQRTKSTTPSTTGMTISTTPSTTQTTTSTTPSTTRMTTSTTPSTTQTTTATTTSTTASTTTTPSTTQITTSNTPSTTQTTTGTTTSTTTAPSTTRMTTRTSQSTTRSTTSTTPSTTRMKTSATTSTTQMTTSTTPSTTQMTSTTSSTTQPTKTTSSVSSTTLNATNTSPLSMITSTTRTTPGTTLSTTTDTPSTRLTTSTRITQSIIQSTTFTTLSTMHSTILLTTSATSGITESNVTRFTSTNPKKILSYIPFTTTMNTETTPSPCSACISIPPGSSSNKTLQHSLETTPATKTTSRQTTTTKRKSSESSNLATNSSTLETHVSASMTNITTPVYETTTQFILKASSKTTTSAGTAVNITANTAKLPQTTSFGTIKANTSVLESVILSVTSTPRELTATVNSKAETSLRETTVAPMATTIALPYTEQDSSSVFIYDPFNVALVSILSGLTAIGLTAGILSYIRSKIAGAESNRSNSIEDESTSTNSSASSISVNNGKCSGSSLSPNTMFSNTASGLPLLTPVD